MSEYDPDHKEVMITRTPAASPGLMVYKVSACRAGCIVQSQTKCLADRDRPNLVETLGELALESLMHLDELA